MTSVGEEVFKFPPCWQDDERMNSLFAPFRAISINPTNWNSKMSFWDSLIEQWCLHHKSPVIELSVLTDNFKRKGKVPSCLPEVVQNLMRNKKLITKDTFYQMTELSWKNWAAQIIINQLQWPIKKMRSAVLKNHENPENVLIHWPILKKLGCDIMESVPEEWKGKLLNINEVQEISKIKSMEVLDLVLRWLESQKMVALHQYHSHMLVKFPKKHDDSLAVTEIDKAFYSLAVNKKMLESNLDKLELERDNLLQEARKNVSAKNVTMAKICLRRKRRVENLIQKLGGGIENIENLIHEMQMAQMTNVILQCYQTGVSSLKNYFQQNKLTKDTVMDAKNEVEGVLIYASDIDSAISESITGRLSDESSEDLEMELENLLKEDIEQQNKKNSDNSDLSLILDKLPEVPSESPNRVVSPEEKLRKDFASLAL